MSSVKEVAILGATGVVGQKAVAMLQNEPGFKIVELAASDQSAGKKYGDKITWMESRPLSKEMANLEIKSLSDISAPYVISALPSDSAKEIEPKLANEGKFVFSNASTFRMDKNVPLMIPEINLDHLSLIEKQNTKGKIITNPNCSTVFITMALAPLMKLGKIKFISIATLQSVSGAGAGLAAYEITGNTIPYIHTEEEKIEEETKKILGTATKPFDVDIIVHVNRVPVLYGHSVNLHVTFENNVSVANVRECYNTKDYVVYDNPVFPQPAKNLDHYDMRTHIGRIKSCSRPDTIGLTALGHNLVRGAAGAAIANMNETLRYLGR